MDLSKYTKEQLLEALAKIEAKVDVEETQEVLDHKFIVGTRDNKGDIAIFRVAADTIEEAREEVRSAMTEDGNPGAVILSLIIGGKSDVAIPCDPIEPKLA